MLTRDKILEAAKGLFGELAFGAVSIDALANAAGVSRVTFYKHFGSKIDVGRAIMEQHAELFWSDFTSLGSSKPVRRTDVQKWVSRILGVFEKNPEVMLLSASISWQDPTLITARNEYLARIIEKLGHTIPAFSVAGSGRNEEVRIRAHMLIVGMNELCYEIAVAGWHADREIALTILTDEIWRFVEAGHTV